MKSVADVGIRIIPSFHRKNFFDSTVCDSIKMVFFTV